MYREHIYSTYTYGTCTYRRTNITYIYSTRFYNIHRLSMYIKHTYIHIYRGNIYTYIYIYREREYMYKTYTYGTHVYIERKYITYI